MPRAAGESSIRSLKAASSGACGDHFSQLYGFISRPDCAAVHYVWMRVRQKGKGDGGGSGFAVHMFPAFSLLLLCVSPMRFDSSRSVLLLTPRKGGSIPALLSQQSLARSAGKCSFTCYFF